jgi:hypothetical protein
VLREQENTVDDWLAIAERNLKAWQPDIFFDQLRTPIRNAYASLFQSPSQALGELKAILSSAKIREARPFHVMNIDAPGGCWELGTQINPLHVTIKAPNGVLISAYAYRFSYLISHALVVDETEVVRHQCNNRACVRPDHLLLGTQAQNRLDDERRKYAGNSPQGRGQTLRGHIPSHLQLRPDPWIEEPLEGNDQTNTVTKTQM